MSPQLRMLLWKEWRERRLLFLVGLVWMVGGTVYNVAQEWSGWRGGPGSLISTAYSFGLFMPIFIAMRTSLGETTDRTRSFTSALPISGQRRGWIRLGGGLAVLMVPILVGAVLFSLCLALGWIELPARALIRGSVSDLSVVALVWRGTAVELSSAASLYLLLSLLGTGLRTEAHAGFVGAAIATLWFFGSSLGPVVYSSSLPDVAAWGAALVPRAAHMSCFGVGNRGLYEELRISSRMLAPLLLHAILQFAMAAWFVRRYSRRLPGRVVETIRKAPSFLWRRRSFPLPNRSIALAWLTLRQSVPMCLPGLLIACLMTVLLVVSRFSIPAIDQLRQQGELLGAYADTLLVSMSVIGFLWAVVVGAGVFAAEIDWRVGEFWRTRPIPFWRFFAAKFFVGLLAVLLVLDGTALVFSWSFPAWASAYRIFNWPYLACIVPLHAVMFAVAVAWTCVLRRPVLGAVAAIVSFALVEEIIHWSDAAARSLDPIVVYEGLGRGGIGFMATGYPIVALGMGTVLFAAIRIAGHALCRYDPRRQSG